MFLYPFISYQVISVFSAMVTCFIFTTVAVYQLVMTSPGIPAALVSVGAMETLIVLLYSPAELVRSSAATAVGYMTYNRGAMRILLTACRR